MATGTFSRVLEAISREVRALLPRKPRRFHAYCVGAGKTGTHSVNDMFRAHFRSEHEPDRLELVELLDGDKLGSLSHDEKVAFLRKRDRRMWLEMDASAFNRRFVGLYAEVFPESKFVMTVRDPHTRTDSLINHMLNHPPENDLQRRRRDAIFRADEYRHGPDDEPLRERGLHPLDGLLADYAEANAGIVASIPAQRLLIIRTDQLGKSATALAQFLEIPEDVLDVSRSHAYKSPKKYGVLASMDPDYVDARVKAHCADLLREHFPEIRSIMDVAAKIQPSA